VTPIEELLTQPGGLSDRLRALRTQAGLSGKELAEACGWQPSRVSKIENGKQMPTAEDIDTWAEICHADAEAREHLLRALVEAQTDHRDFKRRMRRGQAAVQKTYNELVRDSKVIGHFETAWIPGLVQTPDYARRALTEMTELHDLDINDVDQAVAVRMQRQQMIYDSSKRFEFLLAEPVLRWVLGPASVHRGQLDRLQTIIGMPNIRFGVVPMGVPLPTVPQNSFQIYDDVVIVETFLGETTYRDQDAQLYIRVMERLWQEAATGEDARALVLRAVNDLPPDDEAKR
jgi:transcriptional regulator with XRE-family HTH domain